MVRWEDAEFIYRLRRDSRLNEHLSHPPETISQQQCWLQAYFGREALGEEFYFMIEAGQQACGTVRLYRMTPEGHFTWGSWIIKKAAPLRAGIQSALLIYELAFEELGFSESRFEVRKGNVKVIAFHRRCGAESVDETEHELLFRFSRPAFALMKARICA